MVRANSQDVGTGGKGKVAIGGKYHAIVTGAEEHTAKTGNVSIRLTVEILAGTIAEQEGKTMKNQDFYPTGSTFFDMAAALNLTDTISGQTFTPAMLKQMRDDKKAKRESDTEYDFSADECVGRQFFIDTAPELDENKKPKVDGWPRIGFFIRSIVDPETKNIPANEDLIADVLGMSRAEFFGGGQSQALAAQPAPLGDAAEPAGATVDLDAMFK